MRKIGTRVGAPLAAPSVLCRGRASPAPTEAYYCLECETVLQLFGDKLGDVEHFQLVGLAHNIA